MIYIVCYSIDPGSVLAAFTDKNKALEFIRDLPDLPPHDIKTPMLCMIPDGNYAVRTWLNTKTGERFW